MTPGRFLTPDSLDTTGAFQGRFPAQSRRGDRPRPEQDDPRLVRIRTTHPDPSVRDLVEHGFDLGTHHH